MFGWILIAVGSPDINVVFHSCSENAKKYSKHDPMITSTGNGFFLDFFDKCFQVTSFSRAQGSWDSIFHRCIEKEIVDHSQVHRVIHLHEFTNK